MTTHQRNVARCLRLLFDDAHATAVVATGKVDGVYKVQELAVDFAEVFAVVDPEFNRQEFLSLAIDQPGITAVWDPQ